MLRAGRLRWEGSQDPLELPTKTQQGLDSVGPSCLEILEVWDFILYVIGKQWRSKAGVWCDMIHILKHYSDSYCTMDREGWNLFGDDEKRMI